MNSCPPSCGHQPGRPIGSISIVRKKLPELSQLLERLDESTLRAWLAAGVSLFSREKLPELRELTREARAVLLEVALKRYHGNITHMATALGTSRRALRGQLQAAGLYETCRTIAREGTEPHAVEPGVPHELECSEEDEIIPIRTSVTNRPPAVTRDAIADAARCQHPAAFVYMEPGQPVLVDDGLAWLLFFDDWWSGCEYLCNGESMGPVRGPKQLDLIFETMAEVYGEAEQDERELAARHTATLAGLKGAEVYCRAREYAAKRGRQSNGATIET